MDTPVFTVHGKYTEEEYVRFYRFMALRPKRVKWTYGIVFGICFIWLLCTIFGTLFLEMSWLYILLPVVLAAWNVWILTGNLKRRAVKSYRSGKLSVDLEFDLSFFEDHFDAVDPYDHSSIPFDKLHGIHETPTNFYLMTALALGIILRKEDLPEGAAEYLRGVKEKYSL
ncbi:MAG: YcxB family protein [Bacteroidales bacterium]|nr:YcxB family protein [Bacteroidales bacterium]